MFKIVLVDDEELVIKGITATVNFSDIDVKIVGSASNGKQALELISEVEPDLVLTDVKMPIMNGVELAKKLHAASFDGKVIILSAYKEFDYAIQALEAHVYAFLLKPINNDELLTTISNAIEELKQQRKQVSMNNLLTESDLDNKTRIIREIIRANRIDKEDLQKRYELLGTPFIETGHVVIGAVDNFKEEQAIYLNEMLGFIIEEAKALDINGLEAIYHDRITILIDTSIDNIYEILQNALKKKTTMDITYSFGISSKFSSIYDIKNRYQEAKNIALNSLVSSVDSIFDASNSKQFYSKNLTDALKIIHNEYNKNLSIKYISDRLFVSESYIMHMFKSELNKTFTEVLTMHRLNVAKELLLIGTYRISEIAYRIGYNDEKYFTVLFKRTFNMTPSEYSKKHVA